MRDFLRHRRSYPTQLLPRKGRRLVFMLAAVLIGLLPLITAEAVLRYCDIGHLSDANDPYVGFTSQRPLFQANRDTGRYKIAAERQTFFCPDSFPIEKRDNAFRIFCLGGSTVQGRPFAIETSFTTWLKLNLETADPSRQWEVVNCGGISYASYRLIPIMRELLDYEPDLFIICTGHNEFLEDRTYGPVKRTPRWIARPHAWLSQLYTYNTLRSVAVQIRSKTGAVARKQRPQLPEEVNALLDYRGGLDDYHRDAEWRQGTIAHFEFNLHHMVAMARQSHVPVVLVNPPYNLKDSPPFKYVNRKGLTNDQENQFQQLWEEAKQEGITVAERVVLLRKAIAIDDQHAGVRYHLGKCLLSQGQYDAAKAELIAAKDEDICPLRILTSMRDIITEVAQDHAVPLVDAQLLFVKLTPHGITGDEWFVDHVHPSMRGHQRLARALFGEMVQQSWVHPTEHWARRRDQAFLKHLQSLDAMYYVRGQQRLEGLRRWTQGRASLTKPHPNAASPAPGTTAAETE